MSAVAQACCRCDRTFDGTRLEARRARWEPKSTATQALLDRGPLVCPSCVGETLAQLEAAMLEAAQAGRW